MGRTLLDALTGSRARAGRSASRAEASDGAKPLFEKQGFTAQQRNLVRVGDEWLANTTMMKRSAPSRAAADPALTSDPCPENASISSTRRCATAR